MDPDAFTSASPGTLVRLSAYDAVAFVPRPLPPDIHVSRTLLRDVEAARGAIGELVGQARLIGNVEHVISALARREAVYSSRLEGTQTNLLEVLVQNATEESPPEDSDLSEVVNYLDTIALAQAWLAEGRPLNLGLIKELHARLLMGVRGRDKHPGALRSSDVYIGNRIDGWAGARFVPPPVEHVQPLLDDLFRFSQDEPAYGPLIDAAVTHYQFETIHPFEDGNGRLGRLLVALQLMERAVLDRPLLYVGPYLEAHSDEYRDGLLAVSMRGSWDLWLAFFMRALRETADDALARVTRILELRERYTSRLDEQGQTRYSIAMLDLTFESIIVSARQIERATGASAVTAKALIDRFVDLGFLQPYLRIRGRHYWIAQELREQIYED